MQEWLQYVHDGREKLAKAFRGNSPMTLNQMTTSRNEAENHTLKKHGDVHNKQTLEGLSMSTSALATVRSSNVDFVNEREKRTTHSAIREYCKTHDADILLQINKTAGKYMMNIIRFSWMYEYSMIAPDKVLCQLRKDIVTTPPEKSPVFIDTTSKPRIITLVYDPIYKCIRSVCECKKFLNVQKSCEHSVGLNGGNFTTHCIHFRYWKRYSQNMFS